MSNHFSADNLKFPGDDRRLDLTDVFVFTAPHDSDTTVLIIDSNPTSAPPPIPAPVTGPEFYPGAVYRINIDTDGDAHADVAFTFVFSEYEDGRQTGTAWYATGPEARQPGPVGEVWRTAPLDPARPDRDHALVGILWSAQAARAAGTGQQVPTANPGPIMYQPIEELEK